MTEFEMRLTQKRAQEYGKADKQRRSWLITEYCELTGVSRNLASKRFRKKVRDFKPQVLKIEKPKRVGRINSRRTLGDFVIATGSLDHIGKTNNLL